MIRGFMLDSARCLEKFDYYKCFLEFSAARGMRTLLWHFTDDQGCSMQFDCEPEIASPHAFTKAQMRELLAFGKSLGIDIIPELASLGHSVYITRLAKYRDLNETPSAHYSGMCPVSPESQRILQMLIEETASVFDSPNFHVGMDEANIGDHPLTRKALETRTKGELFADHVNFLHKIVTKLNRRMWMWGDALLHDHTIAPKIPHDVVVCNWRYMPNAETSTTQYLLDEGFDVVLCSAMISHNQTLFPAETYALPNMRCLKQHEKLPGKGKILGTLCTIWTPVRYIADSLWLGTDVAARIMRDERDVNIPEAIREFARDFYGFTADENWVTACRDICIIAPNRDEFLPVITFNDLAKVPANLISTRAQRLQAIAQALQQAAPQIQKHRDEYGAFTLLADLLAHVYEAARCVSQNDQSRAAQISVRGQELIARLDAAWDRERFADDPRKLGAPIIHFQDDHLLPLLRKSVKTFDSLMKI